MMLSPGMRIGPYDIVARIGAGGMGEVYKAHDSRLNRDVAIKIYFSSMRTGRYQVWKASVSGGDPVQVTRDGGWVSFESADGRDLYFTTTPMARTALWRIPSAGGQAVKVLDEVMNQSFAPVSRGIYYIDQPAAEARLRFHDIDRRRSVTVAVLWVTAPPLAALPPLLMAARSSMPGSTPLSTI